MCTGVYMSLYHSVYRRVYMQVLYYEKVKGYSSGLNELSDSKTRFWGTVREPVDG